MMSSMQWPRWWVRVQHALLVMVLVLFQFMDAVVRVVVRFQPGGLGVVEEV